VNCRVEGRGAKGLDHVRRRPYFRVAPTEIDDGRPRLRRGSRDPAEKGDEVLLGQALEAVWTGAHPADRISSAPLVGELWREAIVPRRLQSQA
jgi:hypothetical protein